LWLEWLEKSLPRFEELTKENAYRITDTSLFQKTISVANMWHDAHHEEDFQKNNIFLPEYNGRNGKSLFWQNIGYRQDQNSCSTEYFYKEYDFCLWNSLCNFNKTFILFLMYTGIANIYCSSLSQILNLEKNKNILNRLFCLKIITLTWYKIFYLFSINLTALGGTLLPHLRLRIQTT
jgi:hypothetical protein